MDYQQPSSPKKTLSKELALRFISGKYQGGEFPLTEGVPVVVGRSSELDMVLVEEMVSRRHARIELVRGSVLVEDLGSTNGTFVNGERVERAYLNEGDRLLIGTSILKLVSVEEPAGAKRPSVKGPFGKETTRQNLTGSVSGARMTGSLDEIPLPDLMQLFGSSKKTGTLVLHGQREGSIHLRDGAIVHAAIDGANLSPSKAAFRLLSWSSGTFSLEPADQSVSESLHLTAQGYLMEGIRQMDELAVIASGLPLPTAKLTLKTPLTAPLSTLEQPQLEVLQACLNSTDFQAAMDRSSRSDLDVARDVLDLIRRGYLEEVQS